MQNIPHFKSANPVQSVKNENTKIFWLNENSFQWILFLLLNNLAVILLSLLKIFKEY